MRRPAEHVTTEQRTSEIWAIKVERPCGHIYSPTITFASEAQAREYGNVILRTTVCSTCRAHRLVGAA